MKMVGVLALLTGFLPGIVTGLLIGLGLFYLRIFFMEGQNENTGWAIFSKLIKSADDLAFLESDDIFTSLQLVGKGGCGKVYRSELPGSNGKQIAVKRIIEPGKDAAELTEEDSKAMTTKLRQIKSEIQTIGLIRHKNLLPLLAHMSQPDCHYLIYDYMKNGSLQDLLDKVKNGQIELDWSTRLKIALGIAEGLKYLHIDHTSRIIHLDLKPANVLLDDNMEAKIADFGLAKAMPEAYTHVIASNVVGTIGYIAPEYHRTRRVSDKCDIYSFGVLLAVLVMGKFPWDEFFQHTDEMNLVAWMTNVIKSQDQARAIDPKLQGNGHEDQMISVLQIACSCTLEKPEMRPDSIIVLSRLSLIKPN